MITKKVREMSLDEIWNECIAMCRWICKKCKMLEGFSYPWEIAELKKQWLREHGYGNLKYSCFFCSWTIRHPIKGESNRVAVLPWCRKNNNLGCPGTLIDEDFYCIRDDIAFYGNPEEFLKELLRLKRLRKQRARRDARKKEN